MKPVSQLLQSVASGETSIADAERHLAAIRTETIPGATIDIGRQNRCGFGEVIYGEGKSPQLIAEITKKLLEQMPEVLVTRLLREEFDGISLPGYRTRYCESARTLRVAVSHEVSAPTDFDSKEVIGAVAVVTAGSSDAPVADEAAETLAWMRVPVRRLTDIGVAGPQRLLMNLNHFEGCAAVVVVAGMEGALSSVVAGHVPCPVIAVPTSVGYGASMGGITALLSMLTSCAANVAAVNIDAGFKGGYIAGLIAHGSNITSPKTEESK